MIDVVLPNLPLAMWRDGLTTGDEVGVYDAFRRSLIHTAVVRRTPGGKLFIESYGRLDWMLPTVCAPGFGARFVGPIVPNAFIRCYKHDCTRGASTVELELEVESFPSALCPAHAQRPELRGTFTAPTVIR